VKCRARNRHKLPTHKKLQSVFRGGGFCPTKADLVGGYVWGTTSNTLQNSYWIYSHSALSLNLLFYVIWSIFSHVSVMHYWDVCIIYFLHTCVAIFMSYLLTSVSKYEHDNDKGSILLILLKMKCEEIDLLILLGSEVVTPMPKAALFWHCQKSST